MNNQNDLKIISPCISICKTDYSTGFCYGCARTYEEKIIWKDETTTSQWKKPCRAGYRESFEHIGNS